MKCIYVATSILIAALLVSCDSGGGVDNSSPLLAQANTALEPAVTDQVKDKSFTVTLGNIEVRQTSTGQRINVESVNTINQALIYSVAR